MARDFTARVFAAAMERKRLWLINAVGTALLLTAAYSWLWIPDENILQLSLSGLVVIATVLGALVLYGGTLAAFVFAHENREGCLGEVFRTALRHWLALLLWSVALTAAMYYTLEARDSAAAVTGYLHTKFPAWLRARTEPETLWTWAESLLELFAFAVVPLLMLPIGAGLVADGAHGAFARMRRAIRMWQYWIAFILLWVLGVYVPHRLVWWVWPLKSMGAEMASLVARFALAFVLALTVWLLLASAVAAASRPRAKVADAGSAQS